ncbi:unnamed protein product [Durusdinium trenchii]|uniref:Uncharacterized protein n=1 Tax=Durusdinium trenchii TaxID=1381693 RepID=A0ABP0MWW1_9DINO
MLRLFVFLQMAFTVVKCWLLRRVKCWLKPPRRGIQKLGQRLNGAQAAQARGSPEALSSAAVEIMVLQQCSSVLGENCEKYADLLERVGFTLGDDLEKVSDALLESLDRLQAFSDAVARLRAAAEAAPAPGISCRASGGYHEDLD